MGASLVKLGAATVSKETGAPLWQGVEPITDGINDVESSGEMDVMQALGLMSMPYPADENGHAEAVKLDGVGGMTGACVGGRDTRTAKIAGTLKPGDTCVHSTGPAQAAQLLLKEDKRQAVLATKNGRGETQAVVLDGVNEKFQIAVNGCMFEIADGGFTLTDATGKASIMVRNGQINLVGSLVLGGLSPNPALSIMLGPAIGSPGGAASAPMFAAKGVFVGL